MLARRSIQKLLDDSGAYLTPAQIESLVTRLNKNDPGTVDAEWELIILAALACFGEIEHEPNLGGVARLDVRFRSPRLRFVADIRTVSDENYDSENPVLELAAELARIETKLQRQGIDGGFNFRVNGVAASPSRCVYKTKLILPRAHQFRSMIFDTAFHKFVAAIKHQPSKVHYHVVNKEAVSVSIVFNPGGHGMRSYSHPTYNLPHDETHNVVHNALDHKADQIKQAGTRDEAELAGVFLCDGGCGMLRMIGGVGVVGLDNVINMFLRRSSTVDFVCVVDVHSSAAWPTPAPRFAARLWSVRRPETTDVLENRLNQAFTELPPPVRSGANSVNHLNWVAGSLERLYANYSKRTPMKSQSIEFPLRAVINYLSGRIDRPEFERAIPSDWLTHLSRRLDSGKSITDVSLSRHEGEDDDGLVITFGTQDAAISPFRAKPDKEQ